MGFWKRFAFAYQIVALSAGSIVWLAASSVTLFVIIENALPNVSTRLHDQPLETLVGLLDVGIFTVLCVLSLALLYFAVYWRFDNRRVPLHDALGVSLYCVLIIPGSIITIPLIGMVLIAVLVSTAFLSGLASAGD